MTSSPPKILVLTSTFPRWRGDREPPFVFNLCKYLSREFTVHVLAPHVHGAATSEILANVHVTRFRYFIPRLQSLAYEGGILNRLRQNPLRAFLIPFFILSQTLALRRLQNRHGFVGVHAHWLIPQGLTVALSGIHRQRISLLCTSHGGDLYGLKHPLFTAMKRWIARRFDMVTVVSHAMKSELHRIAPDVICQVIPMGTDLYKLFTPTSESSRGPATILFVGRLVIKKGVRYLLYAFNSVVREHPEAELLIAGSGPEENALKRLCEDLDVSNNTRFIGPIRHEDLPYWYRKATVSVVPSVVTKYGDQEGLGLVLIEALGCECPVIASDLPAIHDIIIDGKTGLLTPPADSNALAKHINHLLKNPVLGKNLASAGRHSLLGRFDWESVSMRYTNLIKQLIEKSLRIA